MTVEVRRATVDDGELVARLLRDFNAEFDTPAPPAAVLAARASARIVGGQVSVLLAGSDPDDADGFAMTVQRPSIWYSGPVVLLEELFVYPHLRSTGIGAALVQRVVADAGALGAGSIEINVDEGDDDALRFYLREGFTQTEPGDTERAFYLWRELESP
ncbi:GNAT family N-acetyltransferase [Aeromicrobium alkaliterrae]|uniref:N-acetyltransferase domain-containing protein n=1 Tax=Aeromicrobium alkaliterrae TaxID=302168 RepID=A0ABP4W266_9ACTN